MMSFHYARFVDSVPWVLLCDHLEAFIEFEEQKKAKAGLYI